MDLSQLKNFFEIELNKCMNQSIHLTAGKPFNIRMEMLMQTSKMFYDQTVDAYKTIKDIINIQERDYLSTLESTTFPIIRKFVTELFLNPIKDMLETELRRLVRSEQHNLNDNIFGPMMIINKSKVLKEIVKNSLPEYKNRILKFSNNIDISQEEFNKWVDKISYVVLDEFIDMTLIE